MEFLDGHRPESDLFPVFINPKTGNFTTTLVTLGAYGDSLYEIILKMYIQNGRTEAWLLDMYNWCVDILQQVIIIIINMTTAIYWQNNAQQFGIRWRT